MQFNEKEVLETISLMSKKQILNCIIDITANIQVIKMMAAAGNAYKSDMLDETTSKYILNTTHKLNNEISYLNDKLNLLIEASK